MESRRERSLGSEKQNTMSRLDRVPRSKIETIIDEWIRNERDRAVLKRRLLDGITYERLAEEFGLSVRRTKSIVYKGVNRIADLIPPFV